MRLFLPLVLVLVAVGCGGTDFVAIPGGDGSTTGDGSSTADGMGSPDGSPIDSGRDACAPSDINAAIDPPPGFCPTLMLANAPYFCDDFGFPSEQLPRPTIGWTQVVDYCSERAGHRIVSGGQGRGRVYEAWQNGAGTNDLAYLSHTLMPVPTNYIILPMQINIGSVGTNNFITRLAVIRVETNMGPLEASLWLVGNKVRAHVTGGGAMDLGASFPVNTWITAQLKMHVFPNGVDVQASVGNSGTMTVTANPQPVFSSVNAASVRIGIVAFEGAGTQTAAVRYDNVYAWGQ